MKHSKSLLSALLAIIIAFGGVTASAISFNPGSDLGTGKINFAETKNLTSDGLVTYSKATFKDSGDRDQAVYALEFNPTNSNYMPYVYSKYTGTAASVYDSAVNAETQFGADVIAGVNATFFAMNTGSTYSGYWVHDGRLAQATTGYESDTITFGSDGKVNIVKSRLDFKLFHNGKEVTYNGGSGLIHVNKKSLADGVSGGFYYWDTECGTKTDSVIPGLEILCQKQDFGQLSVGNTLKGKVLEIRKDSKYSSVGADEFVLYVKNESPLKSQVEASLAVGDIFEISVNEAIEASRQYTEKSNTSIVAQYPIVKGGKSDTAEALSQLGSDFMNARAQRTSIGLKADGSVVLICGAGRKITDNAPGLTVYELADIMVQLGCVTAYNLDGGGSTAMVTTNSDNSGFDEQIYTPGEGTHGRAVANAFYIVKRQPVNSDVATALNSLIAANEGKTEAAVVAAVNAAKAVVADTKSLTSDYTRSYMVLKSALSGKSDLDALLAKVSAITFKDYSNDVLEQLWTSYDKAVAVRANEAATSDEISKAIAELRTLYDMKGRTYLNISQGKTYQKAFTPWVETPNYDDTDGKELTDGVIGSSQTSAYGPLWVGMHTSRKTGTENGIPYFDATIDLTKTESNLAKFILHAEQEWSAGIEAPSYIEVFVSDDNTNFVKAGTAQPNIPNLVRTIADEADTTKIKLSDVTYTVDLSEGVSGRYVKFRIFSCKVKVFTFITEMQVFKASDPISKGMYLTGFNTKILENYCMIFTPDYAAELTGENANLNWARAIAVEWSEADNAYIVKQVANGSGSNAIKTVPANGFVLGVHGDSGDGIANKAYANTVQVGDKIILHGIDIKTKSARAGSYITSESTFSVKPDATVAIDGTFITGLKDKQTVAQLAANFNGNLIVKDKNGNVLANDIVVSTGVTLTAAGKTYTIVIKGDVSADGKIDSRDFLLVKRAYLGNITLSEAQLKAALLSGSDKPTPQDFLKIKRHFIGTYDIFTGKVIG